MPKYFANKNKLIPSKEDQENGLRSLDAIIGTLMSCDIRPGRSSSGFWLVFKIKKDYGCIDVYFDALNSGETEIDRYSILRGKAVAIKSVNEIPNIETICAESEESIRASLLKGVAAGNVKMEDLPILLEVAKGKDVPFEKWDLFKQQVENEGLSRVKEKTKDTTEAFKKQLEQEEARLAKMKELLHEVDEERMRVLAELYSTLVFLQGDEHLTGIHSNFASAYRSENLVPIGDGYNRLIDSFQKFRTKKGVYVICENKIFHIHDAYLEPGGRAFLLGTHKAFNRTKPEDIQQMIDKLLSAHSSPGSV